MKEGLMFFTDTQWTLVGLVIFFVSFFVLSYVHMKTYRNETLKKAERLPFEGDSYELQ